MKQTIYFNYSIDCELPPDGRFGGPATWQVAEASTLGFVQLMAELGLQQGTTLFVYPDVAVKQKSLFRELAEAGVEIGLHLNGMRYSRLQPEWLGAMPYESQLEAYRLAKSDVEQVTGQPCPGYRACYASTNHSTFPALEAAGFTWTSTSAPGTYKPEIFARWAGGWPFPHHPSRQNQLIPGDMSLYEIPVTRGIRTTFQGDPDRPLDMRFETPPEIVGPGGAAFRQIIEENLREMERRDQPLRAIIGASHNTNPYAAGDSFQRQNLRWVYEHAVAACAAHGYELVPASFADIKAAAEQADAF